ncbi:uncharacterized protein N7487_000927 [Penicillium crustosum]|uniref:uncharacterized protein n=1 Tax=Penicillium crustosum TaxID=36656 RepID=UPI0023828CF4|nr:uncharacterized protein N7487_000927 [Penicillium crustosum]KAJ5417377.1 hypothetical protein N7487_000927 [Penicillium crustosum]
MVAIPVRTPGPERPHRACTNYLTEADNLTVIENSYDTWRASSFLTVAFASDKCMPTGQEEQVKGVERMKDNSSKGFITIWIVDSLLFLNKPS